MFINTYTPFTSSPLKAYTVPSPTTPLSLVTLTNTTMNQHAHRRRSSTHKLPHSQQHHHHHHRRNSSLLLPSPHALNIRPKAKHTSTPPPPKPLNWLWQCHCRRTYAMGVTRRCLDDGHYFCSGPTSATSASVVLGGCSRKGRSSRRGGRKGHRACASEFDYAGWKMWGQWRRREIAARRKAGVVMDAVNGGGAGGAGGGGAGKRRADAKDCEALCDFPSECRWGTGFGVSSASASVSSASASSASVSASQVVESGGGSGAGPATSFEEILGLHGADVAMSDGREDLVLRSEVGDELSEFFDRLVKAAGAASGREVVRSVFERDDDDEKDDDLEEEEEGQEKGAFCVGEDGEEEDEEDDLELWLR